MLGSIPKKSLRSVLMPTDARHVLKFCKDLCTGFDELDSHLTKSSKIGSFSVPKFFAGYRTQNVLRQFISVVYLQRLVEFCRPNCMCEARE